MAKSFLPQHPVSFSHSRQTPRTHNLASVPCLFPASASRGTNSWARNRELTRLRPGTLQSLPCVRLCAGLPALLYPDPAPKSYTPSRSRPRGTAHTHTDDHSADPAKITILFLRPLAVHLFFGDNFPFLLPLTQKNPKHCRRRSNSSLARSLSSRQRCPEERESHLISRLDAQHPLRQPQ